jgi:hypothetical protein
LSSILYDARPWRERAEAARQLAEQLADPKAKATMIEIATGYDTLA